MKRYPSDPSGTSSVPYYSAVLSGASLRRCYDVAPPRVRDALEAEVEFVLQHVSHGARVLELGCGFGRVLGPLMGIAQEVIGIDTSLTSLGLARETLAGSGSFSSRATPRDSGSPDSIGSRSSRRKALLERSIGTGPETA